MYICIIDIENLEIRNMTTSILYCIRYLSHKNIQRYKMSIAISKTTVAFIVVSCCDIDLHPSLRML